MRFFFAHTNLPELFPNQLKINSLILSHPSDLVLIPTPALKSRIKTMYIDTQVFCIRQQYLHSQWII